MILIIFKSFKDKITYYLEKGRDFEKIRTIKEIDEIELEPIETNFEVP